MDHFEGGMPPLKCPLFAGKISGTDQSGSSVCLIRDRHTGVAAKNLGYLELVHVGTASFNRSLRLVVIHKSSLASYTDIGLFCNSVARRVQ